MGDTTMTDAKPSRQLTAAEIVRELRRLRHDPANGRGKARKVPIRRIAAQAGLSRASLYRAINEGLLSDNSREALSPVLTTMLQERA
jgi:hypothetical protein